MDLLQELSAGLLIDFREKQEGKLKRTFVSGIYKTNNDNNTIVIVYSSIGKILMLVL